MSDDERALIAAIQAAPDENTPRLAYADWLDENGTTDQDRARAEWIRMTCDDRSRRTRMPTGQQIRRPRERAWLREVGGGCDLPVGAYATVAGDGRVTLTAMIGTLDGRVMLRDTDTGDDPEELGRRLARHLLDDAGGASLLADLR